MLDRMREPSAGVVPPTSLRGVAEPLRLEVEVSSTRRRNWSLFIVDLTGRAVTTRPSYEYTPGASTDKKWGVESFTGELNLELGFSDDFCDVINYVINYASHEHKKNTIYFISPQAFIVFFILYQVKATLA